MKITLKIFFVLLFLSLLIAKPTTSFAYWHHGYVGVYVGPGPYYYDPYYDPYYYHPYYADPVYVSSPTSSYQPVVINGTTYYLNNGVYYVYTQYGYQAVSTPVGAPATVTQAAAVTVTSASDDVITVNVPNNKGGFTPVVLKKSGTGFIGPQGEFYSEFPKVSQLQLMYGK